jgi:hypothetical protein
VRYFLIAQGYDVPSIRVGQDYQPTIALIKKGKSTSHRTKHISISYFFLKDRIEQGDVEFLYVPTNEMTVDLPTKPLQGHQFRK